MDRGEYRKRGVIGLASGCLIIVCALTVAALSACSPASVTPQVTAAPAVGATRPNLIVVYNFAVNPSEVTLNQSIIQRIYRNVSSPETTQADQQQAADEAAQAVSDTLVKKLQGLGFTVQNVPRGTPPPGDGLIVDGQFTTIDEGNRARRLIIGLGAGASKLDTSVQVVQFSQSSSAPQQTLLDFTTHAESGKMPGAALTMGAGAAAQGGVTAASAAVAGGMSAGKVYRSTTSYLADSTADQIYNYMTQYFATQGWISPDQAKEAKIEQSN